MAARLKPRRICATRQEQCSQESSIVTLAEVERPCYEINGVFTIVVGDLQNHCRIAAAQYCHCIRRGRPIVYNHNNRQFPCPARPATPRLTSFYRSNQPSSRLSRVPRPTSAIACRTLLTGLENIARHPYDAIVAVAGAFHPLFAPGALLLHIASYRLRLPADCPYTFTMAASLSDPGPSSPLSSAPPSSRSSSPLSELSRSPSPPPADIMARAPYPSPPASQQTSQSGSPAPDGGMSSDKDGPPPAKRRRISEKTERSTEHLDLRGSTVHPDQQHQLDRLVNVLHRRQKIVVIAGAGISVSAGSAYTSVRQRN